MSKEIVGLTISDVHAGSKFALCPPEWVPTKAHMIRDESCPMRIKALMHLRQVQQAFWREFQQVAHDLPKLDYLFCLGECVEGAQEKDGGGSVVTTNIDEQEEMFMDIVRPLLRGHPKIYGVRGTSYHVSGRGGREAEDNIYYDRLPNVQALGDRLSVEIGGMVHDLAHHIGRSGVPYGKHTALSREIIYNNLRHEMIEPQGNVFWRGHVHYCVSAGFPMSRKIAYTCPCLKLPGESYGRRFNDFYDIGMLLWRQQRGEIPVVTPIKFAFHLKRRALYHG